MVVSFNFNSYTVTPHFSPWCKGLRRRVWSKLRTFSLSPWLVHSYVVTSCVSSPHSLRIFVFECLQWIITTWQWKNEKYIIKKNINHSNCFWHKHNASSFEGSTLVDCCIWAALNFTNPRWMDGKVVENVWIRRNILKN